MKIKGNFCTSQNHLQMPVREQGYQVPPSFWLLWLSPLLLPHSLSTATPLNRNTRTLPSTNLTILLRTNIPATTSVTRRPVTVTTHKDPTTSSFPTVICRRSSTLSTATPVT
ncbi:uncharacterized protein LOC134766581 [Penaeus indicus]|uniref:uncharacterized protein LOC134766581 n=1 Tax=Penaeus indicus TaxID=29960 RepID=UPI00300CFAFF